MGEFVGFAHPMHAIIMTTALATTFNMFSPSSNDHLRALKRSARKQGGLSHMHQNYT